jgi:hypothetical protein
MTRGDLIVLGGVGLVALVALSSRSAEASRLPEPSTPPPWPPPPGPRHPTRNHEMPRAEDLDEVTALARVIASEAGSRKKYSDAERAVIGWAVRNAAKKRGVTIARLVCTPTCGKCCHGRPFSSAEPPGRDDLTIAAVIVASADEDDPTFGATSILEPATQDYLFRIGAPGYEHDAAGIRSKWTGEGKRQTATIGRWELWT